MRCKYTADVTTCQLNQRKYPTLPQASQLHTRASQRCRSKASSATPRFNSPRPPVSTANSVVERQGSVTAHQSRLVPYRPQSAHKDQRGVAAPFSTTRELCRWGRTGVKPKCASESVLRLTTHLRTPPVSPRFAPLDEADRPHQTSPPGSGAAAFRDRPSATAVRPGLRREA